MPPKAVTRGEPIVTQTSQGTLRLNHDQQSTKRSQRRSTESHLTEAEERLHGSKMQELSSSANPKLGRQCIITYGNNTQAIIRRCKSRNPQYDPVPHSHMGGVYQQCPFCERVFEIGPTDYRPMRHHIRIAHTESDTGTQKPTTTSAGYV